MANYTLNYTGEKVDELLNKIDTAFGEETVMGDTLTWDGDMTDKPVVSLDMGDGVVMNFCKVSEAIPTSEDIANGVTGTAPGQGPQEVSAEVITIGDGYIFAQLAAIISIPNTTVAEVGLTFPETGTWLVSQTQAGATMYISGIKINGYTGFEMTEITTIDPKYLPESDIVFTISSSNAGATSDDAKISCNKTFEQIVSMGVDKLANARVSWSSTASPNQPQIMSCLQAFIGDDECTITFFGLLRYCIIRYGADSLAVYDLS